MSSSISKNRLLHISDLPNIQKYTAIDVNKLLPIHYSTLKDNVLTMIHYQIQNFDQKILIHDPNLTIHSSNYSQVKGGWCEDFDQKDQITSINCIKKSIQIGIIILNYLQAICQASIRHSHRNQQSQSSSVQVISKGQSFTNSKEDKSAENYPSNVKDVIRNKNIKINNFEVMNFDKQQEAFLKQENLTIAYNIYKKSKKYIFLIGINECFTQNFYNAIALYRQWNLERLQIKHQLSLDYDQLYRINIYLQHLYSIARGFAFSSFLARSIKDPFLPIRDSNENKKYLKQLMPFFEIHKDLQSSAELVFEQIKHQQVDALSVLSDTFRIYRFCFTYKSSLQSSEQKNLLVIKLSSEFSKVLTKILAELPININVSYCFESEHNLFSNQVIILMIFNFKSSLSKHFFLTVEEVGLLLKNIANFLNKESHMITQKTEANIADQVFKSSYLIFNKYNETVQMTETLSANKQLKQKLTQGIFEKSPSKFSAFFPLGVVKQVASSQNQRFFKEKTFSETSTIFSKSPGYSEIELTYKKLLKSLEDRRESDYLLNPNRLKSYLKQYLQPYQEINIHNSLKTDEKFSLEFVAICCQVLDPGDIYNIIVKYQENAEAICQFFIQEHNLQKILQVEKLFSPKIEILFKEYLNSDNGFKNIRYNLMINFIKKILQKFCLKKGRNITNIQQSFIKQLEDSDLKQTSNKFFEESISNEKRGIFSENKELYKQISLLDFTELNIKDLVLLLQHRTYNCAEYKDIVSGFLPKIFKYRQQTRYISTVFYHYYIYLLDRDHHQDLVSSFIGDLFYEVVYFTDELTAIALNNSRYRKNQFDLKNKKFYSIIRDGGFLSFGYQIKNLLIPELLNTPLIIHYSQKIVSTIRIDKPPYFKAIVKMIQNSYFSDNFTFLAKLINKKGHSFEILSRNICAPLYRKQIDFLIESMNKIAFQDPKQQVIDPLLNIQLSESGFFKDLLSLNPNLKIAGQNIKQQYTRKIKEKQNQRRKFTLTYFLDNIVQINIEEAWQYIQLTLILKQKVIQAEKAKIALDIGPQVQSNLIYIKQTFQLIYSKLSKVQNYIELSDLVYNISKSQQYHPEISH